MSTMQLPASPARTRLPFWRQLRWNLTLLFIFLAILPIVVVQGLTIPRIRSEAYAQIGNQLKSIATSKHNQITRWLEDSRTAVSLLLSAPVSQELTAFLRANSSDAQRQNTINTIFKEAVAQRDQQGKDNRFVQELFLYTPDGRIVAASDEGQIGKLVSRQPYFAKSLESESLQPPYYRVGSNELVVMMTRRLLDNDGRVLGVLGAQLNLTVLGAIMQERTGLGESGETYLVSQESRYLLTPSRFPDYPLTQAYSSEGIDRGLRGEEGVDIYGDYRSPPVQVIGAYHAVPELQAALLAEIDVDEAMVAANQAQQIGIALSLVAALAAVVIGFFSATRIAGPVTELTQIAGDIADGALDKRVVAGQNNEIGVLGTAFNSMTTRLQQTLMGLEDQVAQRTKELQGALAEREETLEQLRASISEGNNLRETVRNLSSPVLPVLEGILVMPLVGIIDSDRASLLTQSLLTSITQNRAQVAILDVTGVPIVDTQVAQTLIQAATAARLLGTHSVLVGLRPELAQTIVGLGVDLSSLVTHADLQSGVRYALHYLQRRA